jgi:hypothetical protein
MVTTGTSLSLVVPKPVCRAHRFDRRTKFVMSYEDDRLVFRAIARADRTGQPDRHLLTKLLEALAKRGMKATDFDRLSHDGTKWRVFMTDVSIGGPIDLVTFARLRECLGRRRDLERAKTTEPWSNTVDAVLLAIPDVSLVGNENQEP